MKKLLKRVVRLQVYLHRGAEPEAVEMDLYLGGFRPTAWRIVNGRRSLKTARHTKFLLHCENS